MRRPAYIWFIFGISLVVIFAAVGWISLAVIQLDQAQSEAQKKAAFEEDVRLALWRMDSALAPLIAQENARPYFAYSAYYPANLIYGNTFVNFNQNDIMLPSPLLTLNSAQILLHFQIAPDNTITSPQVPNGKMMTTNSSIQPARQQVSNKLLRLNQLKYAINKHTLSALLPEPDPQSTLMKFPSLRTPRAQVDRNDFSQQIEISNQEWQARQLTQQIASNNAISISSAGVDVSNTRIGIMKSVWLNDTLLLARRVSIKDQDYIQGCWLNWPEIKKWLNDSIKDLLPNAELEPAPIHTNNGQERRLAALPIQLIPGKVPIGYAAHTSPIHYSLWIAWACLLLAAIAVAILLFGALSLSERRAAFVSAVTHELRTPLTTFRLYTDMLADGKIQDAGKQQRYLNTLRTESRRLGYLVENVLAYARLERNRHKHVRENISLPDLLNRVQDRLAERAYQADMSLSVHTTDDAKNILVSADISSVEQILLNLVDNACKYAVSAENRTIHLNAFCTDNKAILQVTDHGPGIPKSEVKNIFKPFHKSAKDAANSAPGVGLGLALSRRLARNMNGDLRLNNKTTKGASFEITLPIA